MFNRSIIIITSFRSIATQFVFLKPIMSGVPNDSFLSNPLKRNFRLSGVPFKALQLHFRPRYNIFICSVILGELEPFRNY